MIRTLVVDDDYRVAAITAAHVSRIPQFAVVGQAHTAEQARSEVARRRPHLVLLDLYLPDGHGLRLVHEMRAGPQRPDFIVITAARDVESVRSAMRHGAVHYLVKPFGFEKLRERLTAYRDLRRRFDSMSEADQSEVDDLYALLRPSTPLPKRHSGPTLARVREAVRAAEDDVSATEVAEQVGVSRPTAQRYLSYLAERGIVELRLRYGGPGRPEQRYHDPH